MTGLTDSPRTGNALKPVHTAIIGGCREALEMVPALMADPHTHLLGLVPRHPEDLVHQLGRYGFQLTDPCPLPLIPNLNALTGLAELDLLIDASGDPGTVRSLAEIGLADIPRINPAAMAKLARGNGHPERAEMDLPVEPKTEPDHHTLEPMGERLAKEVGRAYRHGRTVGVLLLQFPPGALKKPKKAIRVVDALERSLRLEDTVGSIDRETITVLLPETGKAVRQVASRLTSTLATLRIRQGESVPCQAVGWAWFPQDGKTAPALLEAAKARMNSPSSRSN